VNRKTLATKVAAVALAVAGFGVGMAGPAAAYNCSGSIVGSYEVWDTYPSPDKHVGSLTRFDLPFVCTSDSSESKTTFTVSHMFDLSYHTVRHFIYDESSGDYLRGGAWGKSDWMTTPNLKNRTQAEYHTSGLTVWNNDRRMYLQCVNAWAC
jgi:hypothetical protein